MKLSPDLRNVERSQIDTNRWRDTVAWTNWWRRLHVLKKVCKAYSSISPEEWKDLPGITNPVEPINHQSIPQNVKSILLRPLVEFMYLEDKRHAIMQVATGASITISYLHHKEKKNLQTSNPAEKQWSLHA